MRHDHDVVVWVADGQVAPGLDYGVRLVERLAARGLRVGRADLTATNGDLPSADLHVLSGGGTSVTDRSGWMRRGLQLTAALVESAHRGESAVLGVCLGSQMIAEALWPGSVRGAERIEAGLTEVSWRPVGTDVTERRVVPAFHYEEIESARAARGGATIIAENRRAGLQGFRIGAGVCGVQFHPELDPSDVRRLVAHHQRTIEAHHHTVAAALGSVDDLERTWRPDVFDDVLGQLGDFWSVR